MKNNIECFYDEIYLGLKEEELNYLDMLRNQTRHIQHDHNELNEFN